ncbi:NitT/TauT family transport system permease protein [Eubacterium uniforme]|uniref:NitT/TauT family transport system permease protein n=1 Tax=Eubacterium uniforme TaxID=39495 RepID=A0A1T4VSU6_9FIRM|nr:ABC transporter permease subunit [Eubacterium uniforme]SKA68043.1 NitT/TauT family transport system permease protein [Eubacterium uniforme]
MILKLSKKISFIISLLFAVLIDVLIPNSDLQPATDKPYFRYFLFILGGVYVVFFIISFINKKVSKKIEGIGPLLAGAVLLLNIINIVCSKYSLLPVLFFPSLDRVFAVFINDRELLIKCVISSGKLLIIGFAIGAIIGFTTGICVGFNKKIAYWVNPLTKVIGPIPATSWSPLVLSLFSTSYQAAIFMIALAVWFPITVMTSNGIQNVQQTYFEVADTLGANKFYKIFKVGIPAALPSVFLGVFYATTGSFITLVTAEMFGCKSGIGWYLNWQKSMMLYANVYAGLILLAVLCNLIITLLFRIKDRLLEWQKGVIKW